MELKFFDPHAEIDATSHWLPHWQQAGACVFLTFRLADAVPKELLDRWRDERETWLRLHPKPWSSAVEQEYHRRFSAAEERWLDAGHGSCLLRDPVCARSAADALLFFHGRRYAVHSWVVMPNHVHALISLGRDTALAKLVQGWKRFSSNQINAHIGRSGSLWQREYFDRLVRDRAHFANCVRYIRRNPEKARLLPNEFLFGEDDLAREVD